ncbi:MAG: PAS domain-containing protein [Desulfobulbaceae bacterium]|uniref:histidine kinase n=1 Tax=Candidatus Desulfatifera sulfidica TaxID=2841691 RepID=A0A8J6N8G5_9BACT|nr:PAS domain-containing protein [Candidatus Desulfatifera sulfidica]
MNPGHKSTGAQRGLIFALIFGGLILTSRANFLLFHSLVEIFSITVTGCIFIIAWNTRHLATNSFLVFLGIAYLFIGGIDTLHTLAYKGLGVFPDSGANLPTQLWIAGRLLESVSLLAVTTLISRRIHPGMVFGAYTLLSALLLATIFVWPIFPDCFIEGSGLTPFKKNSEYLTILILGIALFGLQRQRDAFHPKVLRLLSAAIITTMLAELSFTFYVSVYGLSNLTGHFFKLISFYLVYVALVETSLKQPTKTLFRELDEQHKILARSEQRFQQLADTIDAVFWMHSSTNNTLLYVSPASATIWGRDPEELYQNHDLFFSTIHPDDRDRVRQTLFPKHIQKAGEIEYRIIQPNGSIHWINDKFSHNRQQDGSVLTTGLAADITERKLVDLELRQVNQELTEFNYVVAHDLKAPLRAIGNYCRFLKEDLENVVSKEQQLYLDQLLSASQESSQLVHDLLLYAKIKRNNIDSTAIDLSLLLQRIISSFNDQNNLKINLPGQWPEMSSDPLLLQQIFQNLLENAITFNESSPREVDISWQAPSPGQITFIIHDNGIGIPEQFHQKIFNIFERINPDPRYKGTGIGLAIVHKAVTNLNGSIAVQSQPGEGTSFRVTLPSTSKNASSPHTTSTTHSG